MVTNSRLPRFSRESRSQNIVDVAMQLFARDGYGQTSMSSIAAALGGSKATLYKYFPSKEVLFETAMVQCCEELFADNSNIELSCTDVLEYLVQTGSLALNGMLKPRALEISRLVFSEGARHPEIAEIFYVKGVEPTHHLIAQGLSHFHSSGQIFCLDTLTAARQFLGMIRADVHMRAICGLEPFLADLSLNEHVAQAATTFYACMTLQR